MEKTNEINYEKLKKQIEDMVPRLKVEDSDIFEFFHIKELIRYACFLAVKIDMDEYAFSMMCDHLFKKCKNHDGIKG